MHETKETRVGSLGWEGPLEEGMATHSSILAWRSPWTEEPNGLDYRVAKNQTQRKQLSRQTLIIANVYCVAGIFLSSLPVVLSLNLCINPMRKVTSTLSRWRHWDTEKLKLAGDQTVTDWDINPGWGRFQNLGSDHLPAMGCELNGLPAGIQHKKQIRFN